LGWEKTQKHNAQKQEGKVSKAKQSKAKQSKAKRRGEERRGEEEKRERTRIKAIICQELWLSVRVFLNHLLPSEIAVNLSFLSQHFDGSVHGKIEKFWGEIEPSESIEQASKFNRGRRELRGVKQVADNEGLTFVVAGMVNFSFWTTLDGQGNKSNQLRRPNKGVFFSLKFKILAIQVETIVETRILKLVGRVQGDERIVERKSGLIRPIGEIGFTEQFILISAQDKAVVISWR